MKRKDPKSDGKGMIPIVSIASGVCLRDGMAVESIVMQPVNKPLTGNVTLSNHTQPVTPANTKRNTKAKTAAITCEHCKQDFVAKRPSQVRYCHATCRRRAWLTRNPEKAATLAAKDKARLQAYLEQQNCT